ncbi:hypothetical protein A7A08_01238 [Methyloligella halotolerans]|uniref:PepSY domain-containing protein n=1 Tax=Methyloligella halotolerans TaxID=1177755 RepID=A0A1E2S152_9HYPH|nr:hypothetical protein [Methyloligella halotolerans]ODA68068.1 hypothetical protein A7A08_01238 [Methyloligella halotolerans]
MFKITTFSAILAIAGTLSFSHAALADEDIPPSDEAVKKIEETLAKIGCKGGDYDAEKSGIYEIDDAECDIGPYDIKLDEDFNILVMSRD